MTSFTKKMKLAVLTDIHYGPPSILPQRRGEIADVLLTRAVHRLNHLVKPDVVVVLGDVLDDDTVPDVAERLGHLRKILDKLNAPYIVIPGNHDGKVDAFYRVFDPPAEISDIATRNGDIRFLPFIDIEAPSYNATRSDADIARFRVARRDYEGPIVALQHVCLAPPGKSDIPYNYTNAQAIADAMAESRITLSIGGHYHAGAPVVRDRGSTFINAPALCESPFQFLVVTLDGEQITTERHQLAMPEDLHLVDNHVHTQLAYCGDGISVARILALAQDFGLAGIGFAEHSGQLYFDARQYWGRQCLQHGVDSAQTSQNRMPDYLALKHAYAGDNIRFGLEVDCDFHGNLLVKAEDRRHADFIIGSIHSTPSLKKPGVALETVNGEFMWMLEHLLQNEIDILAHPFRVFRRDGLQVPAELFQPTAALLRQHHVAAEINFHTNEPSPEYVRMCLDQGVKISFGSDTHQLYEVGEFALHLQLLKDIGFDGELADILWRE